MGPQAGKTTASHWIGALDLMTHRIICDVARDPIKATGGRLNKKDGLTRYGDSHAKDKTS